MINKFKMAGETSTREKNSGFNRRVFEDAHSRKRRDSKPPGKKSIPPPTHVGHFFMALLMTICRSVLLIDTSVKVGLYLCGVVIGSVFCDLFAFPRSFFSNKRNFLNVYFVKLGWGWTFAALLLFIFLTSVVYCCGKWKDVRRHLMRLAIGTLWWYVCTKTFEVIDSTVGQCTRPTIGSKIDCIRAEKDWLGLDISGHVFLLIHCLLTISEEAKVFKDWKKIGELLYDDEIKDKRKITDRDISQGKFYFGSLATLIKISVILLTFFVIMWELMLLISIIYRFHTLPQKVAASFIAVFCWFISYRVIFRSKIPWLPCQPGETQLNYMKLT